MELATLARTSAGARGEAAARTPEETAGQFDRLHSNLPWGRYRVIGVAKPLPRIVSCRGFCERICQRGSRSSRKACCLSSVAACFSSSIRRKNYSLAIKTNNNNNNNESSTLLLRRLRHTDGIVLVVFEIEKLTTSGRVCRFAASSSSGAADMAKAVVPPMVPGVRWQEIEIGSTVLACSSTDDGTRLWGDAEVEKLVDQLQVVNVVFSDDGSKAIVEKETLALSEYAAESGLSQETSKPRQCSPTRRSIPEEWLPGSWPRCDTSKALALGLAARGSSHFSRSEKTSLDFVSESTPHKLSAKKKSRGGKRKRDRKFAEARRASKALEEAEVFSFINVQLSSSSRMDSSAKEKKPAVAATGKSKEDRRSLVRQQDEIKELASKVAKLEEMARRNRKEKSVFEAVTRKLGEARKALGDAEAARPTQCAARKKRRNGCASTNSSALTMVKMLTEAALVDRSMD
ncbi:hypothetical protein SELMODRAFT_424273 [Selaginella moellendorffii]|uniref:Uncharacterized protein n=1 Tax=Selaginella moellendorffii TaxID=88036 RepID=D8SPC7_SELML|nr:hypothetical protein SELMODRAFT_424273 [Selaginella moellendorffii]